MILRGSLTHAGCGLSRLLDLSIHHLVKLNEGQQVYFEKLKGIVMEDIAAQGFAAHFSLTTRAGLPLVLSPEAGVLYQERRLTIKTTNKNRRTMEELKTGMILFTF
jgi:hypothetical protein